MGIIPKIIHCCWFGKSKMPKLAQKCIESWTKYLPEYEIKKWDEDNFDVNMTEYTKEAYNAKKYAFVSDYVRIYALYHYGGIYMDTDVEVLRPLDPFLCHEAFSGLERMGYIPTGIIGAKPKNKWIEKILLSYESRRFIQDNGCYDLTTNVTFITNLSKELGFDDKKEYQTFHHGVVIYPSDYFCANDLFNGRKLFITDNTYTIHHFAGSWLTWDSKCKLFLRKKLGHETYEKLKNIYFKIIS